MANNFLKENEKTISRLLLAVGAYFTIIKPLLQKTNVIDTKEEKAEKADKNAWRYKGQAYRARDGLRASGLQSK